MIASSLKTLQLILPNGKDFAGFIDKNEGDLTLSEDGYLRVSSRLAISFTSHSNHDSKGVLHQPLGICAAIIPFNSPTITFAMKVAPALATGNVIIVKVSETNPFSGLVLGELATQAGIPPGVVNVLCGAVEAGQALSSHLKIRKISFTGNPAVGRAIQIAAAKSNLKRVTLELGGKSPVLVFDDADLINAVTNTMAFLSLNGQGCVLGTRVYVQEGVADTFVAMVKEGVSQLAATLGADPFDERTFTSPLYHRRQRDIVAGFLEKGKSEATVITGGDTWGEKGCYVQPTIFYKPKPGSDVLTKEIFGPVLVVDTFQTESEVLDKANDSEYGLGAYVYTKNIDRAIRLSKALEAGSVAVNVANPTHVTLPFGGWKGNLSNSTAHSRPPLVFIHNSLY